MAGGEKFVCKAGSVGRKSGVCEDKYVDVIFFMLDFKFFLFIGVIESVYVDAYCSDSIHCARKGLL